jgi:endonuclease/exonuclease/phosphatase family metal-dependent hydrolase
LHHADLTPHAAGRRLRTVLSLVVAALALTLVASPISPAAAADSAAPAAKKKGKKKKKKKKKTAQVRVMTRNLYLGADLGPALSAGSLNDFVDAAGQVVNQVDRTNFPLRAQALAQEIIDQKADVVGLQEVAFWGTGPLDFSALTQPPKITTPEYDFMQLLLDQLKAKGQAYRLVVLKNQFDFESPVNDQGPPGGLAEADRNARFIQRDAIIVRDDAKIKTSNPASGTFPTLLRVVVAGSTNVDVTRGWTSATVDIGKAKPFKLVNLHFEAFDSSAAGNKTNQNTTLGKGQIRASQAYSLFSTGGPIAGTGLPPVILTGDINSDDDTVAQNGDHLAYNALLSEGLRPVDTANPLSCCLNDPELVGGALADYDHHIDHVMTNSPKKVTFAQGFVTGLFKVNGLQPSDHAGVTSVLNVPRDKAKKKKKKKGKKK